MTQTSIGSEEDLETLFDRIAVERAQAVSAPEQAPPAAAKPAAADEACTPEVFKHLGSITRKLHDALRELGYDQKIESALHSLPDAQARLGYIATLTGKAAERALSGRAGQTGAGRGQRQARCGWSARWDHAFANQAGWAHRAARNPRVPRRIARGGGADQCSTARDHDGAGLSTSPDRPYSASPNWRRRSKTSWWHCWWRARRRAPDPVQQRVAQRPAVDPAPGDVVADQGQVDQLLESLGF